MNFPYLFKPSLYKPSSTSSPPPPLPPRSSQRCESDSANFQTGDIILFSNEGGGWFDWLFSKSIKTVTHSKYTHCGMVLKDPEFIDKTLKGLFLWESGWENIPDAETGKDIFGVRITPLYPLLKECKKTGKTYIRRLNHGNVMLTPELLNCIHKQVLSKPYDIHIMDWLGAAVRYDFRPQKMDRFWCSAFLAYIMVQVGFVDKRTDWSICRPCDFSAQHTDSQSSFIKFFPFVRYDTEEEVCIL